VLTGRIFDDRGNRMSPSHARKHGIKYRYYLSSALLQGRPEGVGSVRRVPAAEIEALVVGAVRERLRLWAPKDEQDLAANRQTKGDCDSNDQLVDAARNHHCHPNHSSTAQKTMKPASGITG
jgi:hypothetical protein